MALPSTPFFLLPVSGRILTKQARIWSPAGDTCEIPHCSVDGGGEKVAVCVLCVCVDVCFCSGGGGKNSFSISIFAATHSLSVHGDWNDLRFHFSLLCQFEKLPWTRISTLLHITPLMLLALCDIRQLSFAKKKKKKRNKDQNRRDTKEMTLIPFVNTATSI